MDEWVDFQLLCNWIHAVWILNSHRWHFRPHAFWRLQKHESTQWCLNFPQQLNLLSQSHKLYAKCGHDAEMRADTVHLISGIKTLTFGLWYIQERTSHSHSWKAAELLWSSEDVSSSAANLLWPSHVLTPLVHSRFFYVSLFPFWTLCTSALFLPGSL